MRHNIGVAIAVPQAYAEELESWRVHFGDPAAHLIQAHITLLPPTTVNDLDAVMGHLAAVASRHDDFHIELRGTGTFRPLSPVVYVRVARGAEQITTLQADVRSGPLGRQLRFEYHPHVTVANEVADEVLTAAQRELADYRAQFDAEAITVYEQANDGVWSPLQSFPLHPAGA